MRLRMLVLLSLFGCAHLRSPGSGADLRYRLEVFREPMTAVKVTLSFAADAGEFTGVHLGPGAEDDLRQLQARGDGGRELLIERTGAERWRVRHRPGERLELSYTLLPPPASQDASNDRAMRALIAADVVQLIAETSLLMPEGRPGPQAIAVEWRGGAEAGWSTLSSLGDGATVFATVPLEAFRQALFVAGRLRVSERSVDGAPLRLAVAGERWSFQDAALADALAALVRERDAAFGVRAAVLVSLVPIPSPRVDQQWIVDAPLDGAVALRVSPDVDQPQRTIDRIRGQLADDLAQDALARIPLAGPSARFAWFRQGFAEFYHHRLLRRAGALGLRAQVARLNGVFTDYFINEARGAGNLWLEAADGALAEMQKLARQRGEVLAWLVDAEVRKASGGARSLDALMRELLQGAKAARAPLDEAGLLDRIQSLGSRAASEMVWAVVEHGAVPDVAPDLFAPCLRMSFEARGPYELGFDFEASRQGRVVKGVRFGSRAYQAGLRDGQRLLDWTLRPDRPDEVVELKVTDHGFARAIAYTPQGRSVPVPVFSIADEASCAGL